MNTKNERSIAMRNLSDPLIAKTRPEDRDRLNRLIRKSSADLIARYMDHRPKVNDEKAGEILRLFCDGGRSQEIAAKLSIPIETVRAIISYACSRSSELYKWHSEAGTYYGYINSEAPARAVSYVRYAPLIR